MTALWDSDIEELDSVTAELLKEYMRRAGWTFKLDSGGNEDVLPPKGAAAIWSMHWRPTAINVAGAVRQLASFERRSVQAVARDIAPRWMGWPTDEEIEAHAGLWMAQRRDDGCIAFGRMENRSGEWCFVASFHRWYLRLRDEDYWRFWPCDDHGNRVRRKPPA